jgi:hypothetical protein
MSRRIRSLVAGEVEWFLLHAVGRVRVGANAMSEITAVFLS